MVQARRTLVKSVPELWAELSDPVALARHLEPFGDVRPVDCDGESLVAWEGEHARGRVQLEPSGWGTKVTLEAALAAADPAIVPEPRPRGLWARLRRRRPPAAPPPQPRPRMTDDEALLVLTGVLDALGRAHHRPFSRA
jgi:hypothetical protein